LLSDTLKGRSLYRFEDTVIALLELDSSPLSWQRGTEVSITGKKYRATVARDDLIIFIFRLDRDIDSLSDFRGRRSDDREVMDLPWGCTRSSSTSIDGKKSKRNTRDTHDSKKDSREDFSHTKK
jgi:hypothetical protein